MRENFISYIFFYQFHYHQTILNRNVNTIMNRITHKSVEVLGDQWLTAAESYFENIIILLLDAKNIYE